MDYCPLNRHGLVVFVNNGDTFVKCKAILLVPYQYVITVSVTAPENLTTDKFYVFHSEAGYKNSVFSLF